MPVKLLLLKSLKDGVGLDAIKKHESELIDISDDEILSDATCSNVATMVIKDNTEYTIARTFWDLDKNRRVVIAVAVIL